VRGYPLTRRELETDSANSFGDTHRSEGLVVLYVGKDGLQVGVILKVVVDGALSGEAHIRLALPKQKRKHGTLSC